MSLYNLLYGVNQCTFFFLPMLGKHPEEYPRFRDCFLQDPEHPEYDYKIHVYTRVGGANRGQGYGEEELQEHPLFIATFDDNADNTYATYVFDVPEEFKEDFDKLLAGNLKETSREYKDMVYRVFPKLKEKMQEVFGDG